MCWAFLFILNQPAYTAIFKCLYTTLYFPLHVEIHITLKALSSPTELRNDLTLNDLEIVFWYRHVVVLFEGCCFGFPRVRIYTRNS